jgi:hypothetical protein
VKGAWWRVGEVSGAGTWAARWVVHWCEELGSTRETSVHTGARCDSEESGKYLRLTRRASEIEGGQDLG